MKTFSVFLVLVLASLGLNQVAAKTSQYDLEVLYLIKEEVKDRDPEWKNVVDSWTGGGENGEDDPCGYDWRGTGWHGVECRGQEGLSKDIDRVVTNIHITDSHVGGPVPLGMSLLKNLIELDMDGNVLTGPLIPQVACLTQLTELDLANNTLTGTIPPAWGALSGLEEAELEVNYNLEGCIPQGMPPTKTLCPEELPYCELVGTITDDTSIWGYCQDIPNVDLWCPSLEEVREFIDSGMDYYSL